MMSSNIINVFQCSAFIAFSFKSYFKLLNVIPRLLYYHIIFFFLTTWKISNRILTISSFISIDEIIFLDDYQISEEFLSQCSSKTVILVWISLKRQKKYFFGIIKCSAFRLFSWSYLPLNITIILHCLKSCWTVLNWLHGNCLISTGLKRNRIVWSALNFHQWISLKINWLIYCSYFSDYVKIEMTVSKKNEFVVFPLLPFSINCLLRTY